MSKYTLLNQDIDTSFLTIEMTWAGMRSPLLKKQVGMMVPNSFCELIQGETLNYFQNEKQALVFSHRCTDKVINNRLLLTKIKRKSTSLANEALKIGAANFPLPRLSDLELVCLINDIRKIQMDLAAWGMVVAFADIYGEISNKVTEIFSSRDKLKLPLNDYLETLTNPSEPSASALAYQKIKSANVSDDRLCHRYFWLDQGYIGRGLKLSQLRQIRKYQIENNINSLKTNSLLRELKLSIKEKKLLVVAKDLVAIKSLRADARQALHVVLNNIVDRLARRWSIPAKYIESLSALELCSLIAKSQLLPKNLSQRWQRSLIIPIDMDDYHFLCGKKIDPFLSSRVRVNKKNLAQIEELKGQVAQPGKIKGRVKLIFGSQHNNKVKSGDILVSVSTSPQLLPAMKLAAAFVTEVGGITSHAAIVARELHKPCIVGVKLVTQILHDGDLVEVDADKGIIKIIKN